MYKALITDLDGTAVRIGSDGSDVTDEMRSVISRAVKNGSKIACATGRGWVIAKPVVKNLNLEANCIVEGGTRIINPVSEETVWECFLDDPSAQIVLEIYKRHALQGQIIHSQHNETMGTLEIAKVPSIPEKLRYLYAINVPKQQSVKILEEINKQCPLVVAHQTPSWNGDDYIDIHTTSAEATKEHAIKVWQQIEGILPEETIGMGDSGNDLPIFRSCGLKIAVGNALDSLKRMADEVVISQEKGAVAYVINKYLL